MKIIIFVLLVMISVNSFCQQTKTSQPLTREDYLKKSKHQNTAAWFLVVGGASLLTTGLVINKGDLIQEYFIGRSDYKNSGIKSFLTVTGISLMSGGIYLFISSARNKEKGMSASAGFKMEKLTNIQQRSFIQSTYPAVSIKISL